MLQAIERPGIAVGNANVDARQPASLAEPRLRGSDVDDDDVVETTLIAVIRAEQESAEFDTAGQHGKRLTDVNPEFARGPGGHRYAAGLRQECAEQVLRG